jgi:transposase
MSKENPNTYTAEFRASAVKLANESDKPISQVAKDIGINVNTLHIWIGKYSRPKESNKTVRSDEHPYDELKRLKKSGPLDRGARFTKKPPTRQSGTLCKETVCP